MLQACIYCECPRHAPALGSPLNSLYRCRSRSAVFSSGGLRWCFALTEPWFGVAGLATVSVFYDLCVACAVLEMTSRLSAMQVLKMVVSQVRDMAWGNGLGA